MNEIIVDICVWVFSIALLIGFFAGISWLVHDTDLELLNSGVINEQQYCIKKQDSKQPPARCYKYFGVKPVGVTSGKNPQTILIPNN